MSFDHQRRALRLAVTACLISSAASANGGEPSATYRAAADAVAQAAGRVQPAGRAKNVILFVGDGMGVTTVTAARILEGQLQGGSGEENDLTWDEFERLALIKTYSVNQQTSDSAPTATAMVTGDKANDGAIAVGPQVDRFETDWEAIEPYILETVLEQAEQRGLATGIVTTARLTHATPAVNYAHIGNRDWETDSQLPDGATVKDIAAQLIDAQARYGLEVALGGGRTYFMPGTQSDPEYGDAGRRSDGRDLIAEWMKAQPRSAYVWNEEQFDAISPRRTRHLLGLFEPSHMQYEADRVNDAAGEPSLADMTRKAIQILSQERRGFYLMVEAGRIDHGHHAGNAYRALTDTIALSDAVHAALQETNPEDTLILVTADHSHVFTIGGYPERGNPILGLVKPVGSDDYSRDYLGFPYATLSYANGLGYASLETGGDTRYDFPITPGRIVDLSTIDTQSEGFHQEALVGLSSETHAGEDVALYATGPNADRVAGTMDQNEIYFVMRTALGF
jgi:alkaline phosphatase